MSDKTSSYTDFLYARPSFLEGLARIADFFGVLQDYNTSSTPEAADERTIRADWAAVGADLWSALNQSPLPPTPSHGRPSPG